ncbi:hypothetical protein T08_8346 [Trichinella sp. T8]|nr:hypothetical protein T08_8346 [Trichinella sp. T8]
MSRLGMTCNSVSLVSGVSHTRHMSLHAGLPDHAATRYLAVPLVAKPSARSTPGLATAPGHFPVPA